MLKTSSKEDEDAVIAFTVKAIQTAHGKTHEDSPLPDQLAEVRRFNRFLVGSLRHYHTIDRKFGLGSLTYAGTMGGRSRQAVSKPQDKGAKNKYKKTYTIRDVVKDSYKDRIERRISTLSGNAKAVFWPMAPTLSSSRLLRRGKSDEEGTSRCRGINS